MGDLPSLPSNLETWAKILNDLGTFLAIVIGGVWAAWHFRLWRRKWPKANLGHSTLGYDVRSVARLLHVTMTISNVGEVLLKLRNGLIRVQQLRPWPAHLLDSIGAEHDPFYEAGVEYPWPQLAERAFETEGLELEPAESEEYCFDFFVSPEVQTVVIYTYVQNVSKGQIWRRLLRKKSLGWQKTTVYDFNSRHLEPGGVNDETPIQERTVSPSGQGAETSTVETTTNKAARTGEATSTPSASAKGG